MPTIQLRDTRLQGLVEQMVQDHRKLSEQDVNTLVKAAYADDGRLSRNERASLQSLLQEHRDLLESPEARRKLEQFGQMTSVDLRDAAARFAQDGSVTQQDARELQNTAMRDGQITKREKLTLKALLGFYAPQMEPGARELVAEMAGLSTRPTPQPSGAVALELGSAPGRNNPVLLHDDGTFALRDALQPGGRFTDAKAEALYAAGELIAGLPQGANLFTGASSALKAKTLDQLQSALTQGLTDADPSNTAKMRMRAGAQATLLELARSANSPQEQEIRQVAVDRLLEHLEKEPVRGMRRNLLTNLEHVKELCTPRQLERLEQLHAQIVPQQPPYEKWFKDGNRTLEVKQYLHSEFYDETINEYKSRGFTQDPRDPKIFTRTYEDPTGAQEPMTVRISVESKDTPIFTEMDDKDKHIIFYSGHSNLGGNTKNALAWSQDTKSTGDKLIIQSLCRGNQVAAAVSNRFSEDHQITTNDSVTSRDEFETLFPMFEIMARRGSYEEMYKASEYRSWDDPKRAAYVFPHDTKQVDRYADADKDGAADAWASGVDRLFNVGLESPSGGKHDLTPLTQVPPAGDLDGSKLISGIEFANTILHYHMESNSASSPFRRADDDKLIPGGWFHSDTNDPIRVIEERKGSETFYRIQVNSKYANQSEEALGALVGYEIANHFDRKHSGDITRPDMMRNFYLSNEYLYFMGGNDYLSNTISGNLAKRYDLPAGLDFYDHQSAHRSASNHDIADDARIGNLIERFKTWVDGN